MPHFQMQIFNLGVKTDALSKGNFPLENKIFLQNYLFFWLKYNIIKHKSQEQTFPV